MKRTWSLGLAAIAMSSCLAMAQMMPPAPPSADERGPKDDGGPPPPGMSDRGGPDGLEERMRIRRQQGGQPPSPGMRNPVEAMKQYLDLVGNYAELAKDSSATGVSAVITLAELAKQQSPSIAIERLTKLLGETKDVAVQRAIRLTLIDLYRANKEPEKAIEQAEILIRGA